MIVVFLGPPGSGKDTQAKLLKDKYGFDVVSTGDLFRAAISSGSELGNKIKEKYDKGLLMTDHDVEMVLEDYFVNTTFENIVLTGVVRTKPQIAILDRIFEKFNLNLTKVLYFKLSDELVVERISNRLVCDIDNTIVYHKIYNPAPKDNECTKIGGKLIQRDDDKEDVIKTRLEVFHTKSEPVLGEYESREELLEIDADQDINEIHELIVEKLKIN